MVDSNSFYRDILFFIKDKLTTGVTDPLSGTRSSQSKFVMTSYPSRFAQYPLITIKITNVSGTSAGMQTNAMDVVISLEIRVWARNQKEKDELANDCYKYLRDIQFTTDGSIDNYIYNFKLNSMLEVDEEGENQPKSRLINIEYKFFDV